MSSKASAPTTSSTSCPTYTAFCGAVELATGPIDQVALAMHAHASHQPTDLVLLFSDQTGEQLDLDLRGAPADVLKRLADHPLLRPTQPQPEVTTKSAGRGRPRLGVVCREISLLPRHWDWLGSQGRPASATLRRLVDEAVKKSSASAPSRQRVDATYRVMSALAGNLPQFEEASRALFAHDAERFADQVSQWPKALRSYLARMLKP